jgi:hypothetical protein
MSPQNIYQVPNQYKFTLKYTPGPKPVIKNLQGPGAFLGVSDFIFIFFGEMFFGLFFWERKSEKALGFSTFNLQSR